MTRVLDAYLALHEREAEAPPDAPIEERAAALEDLVAAHRFVFEMLERRIGKDGLAEAHRPLIPVYQRWMQAARRMVVRARELRAEGRPVTEIDGLVCDINLAKLVAEDFDYTVESNERFKRGEPPGPSRPLDEFLDELRAKDREQG